MPRAPLHLGVDGEVGACDLWARSDTLFGALVNAAAELGRLDDLCPDGPPGAQFAMSSVFPYWRDVLFFPKPHLPAPTDGDRRRWKRVRFVSERVLTGWLAGESPLLAEHAGDAGFVLTGDELGGGRLPDQVVRVSPVDVNVLDRRSGAATPYQRGRLLINTDAGGGLFFLASMHTSLLERFQEVLAEVGRRGLGGERSSGLGGFEISAVEPWRSPLLSRASGSHFISLSLFSPRPEEVEAGLLRGAAYDTVTRGGWIYWHGDTGLRKRKIRMLTEGSVFRHVNRSCYGAVVDVTPAAFGRGSVYRWGRAFPLFFDVREEASL